ncbi:unnamed protein product, partial [Musa acuminata var. zebrina]
HLIAWERAGFTFKHTLQSKLTLQSSLALGLYHLLAFQRVVGVTIRS